ncbi:MAG: histidinol-phosphatase HisJ family protein [Spirochaetales bacterium]|nr:histidinol-phosphatase HisJ family protein [Spirochaetales bacterium]
MNHYDMHCHSVHSEDTDSSPDDMCRSALEKSIKGIAFTEHVDFNPADKGFDYFDAGTFQTDIDRLRQIYSPKLGILKGMEFSEPHLYPREFRALSLSYDWDVIIGSVHMMGDRFVGDCIVNNGGELRTLYRDYYALLLDMVEKGGFDILGHLDFPKRYFGKAEIPVDHIKPVLRNMIEKGIALEVNTSPWRKGLDEFSPHREILELYAGAGGEMITLGSDAHIPGDVAADFKTAEELIGSIGNLKIGRFEKRKFIEND